VVALFFHGFDFPKVILGGVCAGSH
jgi:hypothetical protein